MIKYAIKLLYMSVIYPLAKKYVESTDNEWDDTALEFLDSFIKEILKKVDSTLATLKKPS